MPESAGIRIPGKLTVVGFDNILEYIQFLKPISSVDCNLQKESCAAIDMIRGGFMIIPPCCFSSLACR